VRVLRLTAQWLFILCLPVLLLTASIGVAVNSIWLYEYGFEKYSVGQTTGLAEVELEKAAKSAGGDSSQGCQGINLAGLLGFTGVTGLCLGLYRSRSLLAEA